MSKLNLKKHSVSYHDDLMIALKKDREAEAYLKVALEEFNQDADQEAFMLALKNLTEARGGVGELAEKTQLNRQNLYRVLSSSGNPRLDTLASILHALGFELTVSKAKKAA